MTAERRIACTRMESAYADYRFHINLVYLEMSREDWLENM